MNFLKKLWSYVYRVDAEGDKRYFGKTVWFWKSKDDNRMCVYIGNSEIAINPLSDFRMFGVSIHNGEEGTSIRLGLWYSAYITFAGKFQDYLPFVFIASLIALPPLFDGVAFFVAWTIIMVLSIATIRDNKCSRETDLSISGNCIRVSFCRDDSGMYSYYRHKGNYWYPFGKGCSYAYYWENICKMLTNTNTDIHTEDVIVTVGKRKIKVTGRFYKMTQTYRFKRKHAVYHRLDIKAYDIGDGLPSRHGKGENSWDCDDETIDNIDIYIEEHDVDHLRNNFTEALSSKYIELVVGSQKKYGTSD